MKYTECTTEELLHFIRQRLGPLRNKITRQSALKILKVSLWSAILSYEEQIC